MNAFHKLCKFLLLLSHFGELEYLTYFVRNPAVPYWMGVGLLLGCFSRANFAARSISSSILRLDSALSLSKKKCHVAIVLAHWTLTVTATCQITSRVK